MERQELQEPVDLVVLMDQQVLLVLMEQTEHQVLQQLADLQVHHLQVVQVGLVQLVGLQDLQVALLHLVHQDIQEINTQQLLLHVILFKHLLVQVQSLLVQDLRIH
jgi:hypothetical protein